LLFYIFLSHGNEKKEKQLKKGGGVGCKKGWYCVLSTSTCEQNIRGKKFTFTRMRESVLQAQRRKLNVSTIK
jgi:hypothetical protein